MDKLRLQQDLLLLKHASIRHVDWTFDALGIPNWIKVLGAFRLDPKRFNYPDLNLLIPVSDSLYDPSFPGRFFFYEYVYVDRGLQVFDNLTQLWRPIHRGYDANVFTGDVAEAPGWQWICVMNPTCGPSETILDLFASIQTFLYNDA